ncbi:c-type cytochrome [Paenibacillus sp. J2TS4]|uniref:c-type cytochrome n=1 Tax=Paenibacillus sp. J2TS4 TaxID=2807194 RepID=UPI001B2E575C|nr:c-type cytochrome [Paenibacillus sp. J2TS4]GIP31414.1 hypothetical protein J2TS4_06240 [Paenibacillus sp. J2TS4]
MKTNVAIIIGFFVLGAFLVGYKVTELMNIPDSAPASQAGSVQEEIKFNPPSLDDVPEGPVGEAIKYGYQLISETDTMLPDYVGNKLSCISCHAGAGLDMNSSPFVGVTTAFPQYRAREGIVFTLEDRINGCMVRSMNGEELPYDSEEMRAMMAYLTYISDGIPVGADLPWRMQNATEHLPIPDLEEGEQLYKQSCLACHGVDGSGTGSSTGPALWGDNSFNDGAGLSRMTKLAGYIMNTMPKGQGGSLTDQEVSNVAAFILSMDRPEWKGHDTDWPNGGRPKDIMNKELREQIQNGTINWEEILN